MRLVRKTDIKKAFEIDAPDDSPVRDVTLKSQGKSLVDAHLHSRYSDGQAGVREIEDICARSGIGCCITDHNEIRGSLRLWERGQTLTVPSIELGSDNRLEMLAYFRNPGDLEDFFVKHVEPYRRKRWVTYLSRPLFELIEGVREYESLLVLPHPFAPLWKNIKYGAASQDLVARMLEASDGIEVYNGSQTRRANHRAWQLCASLNKIPLAGSDSHQTDTIGTVLVVFDRELPRGGLFDAIKRDQVVGLVSPDTRSRHMANTWRLIQHHTWKFISGNAH